MTGQSLPPAHPHVAQALADGAISVEAAGAITSMLDRVARRADPAQSDGYEQVLAQRAGDIPFETLLRAIREAETRLDQGGVEPREDDLREDRAVYLRQDHHGMLHLAAHVDPESAGPVKRRSRRSSPTPCGPAATTSQPVSPVRRARIRMRR